MEQVKVRYIGNSDMVAIPRALGAAEFTPGADVLIEAIDSNTIVLKALPTDGRKKRMEAAMRQSIERSKPVLDLLEEYDRAGELAANP
ncbi:MAG: AbrB/MazE/SpoVT family DNA-binding domain-containing protein [Chloroflexota bacterium]